MQVDQDAYGDLRPVVGIMAHAYANPLISTKHNSSNDSSSNSSSTGSGSGETTDTDTDVARERGGQAGSQEAAAAAANELVIDALLAAEADTIGPEVRFLGLQKGAAAPPKKPHGGAWRGADGLRVVESSLPEGLVKKGWLHKHTRELPGSLVYLATVDVSAAAEDWADTEDEIVADLRSVVSSLAERDVKVLLVLVRAGAEAGHGGGREERDVADERALSVRRRAEIDARMVLTLSETELASRGGSPASVRRIAKAAKDLSVAHYASHISRLRRWEKVLVPTQRLYRPLLTRLYFKLGVLHEMQGLVDRSVLCYQEVSALLSDMVPRDGRGFSGGDAEREGLPPRGGFPHGVADPMEQASIRGVAEAVHLRLVRNHLHRNMSVEGAIRQLRRHVSAFGRPAAAAAGIASPPASSSGSAVGVRDGEQVGAVPEVSRFRPPSTRMAGRNGRGHVTNDARRGACFYLFRLSLCFLPQMLSVHISQFPSPAGARGGPANGGQLGYTSPGYYYLGAALQAVRRRKSSGRLLREMDKDKLQASLDGLEVREALYLGESVRLVDPNGAERDLRRECRAFLDLEEAKTDRAEVARSLLVKALEHCPLGVEVFRRRRVLVLSHLAEECFVSLRYDEALERLPVVWKTYLADGWLQLATASLRRMYAMPFLCAVARTAADVALRLSSEALRPWMPADESKRLLSEALPLPTSPHPTNIAPRRHPPLVKYIGHYVTTQELEVKVDASRRLMRLSGRFSAPEASAGDGLKLTVALASLLPLETRLETLELNFNHPALDCVIRDTRREPAAPAAASRATPSSSELTADLTLPPEGLLTAEVSLCLPWEGLPPSGHDEPLRLVEARALMKRSSSGGGADAVAVAASGVVLSVPAGPGSEISRKAGCGKWARVPGFETVRLVPPRARAHVSITEPSSVLLGLVTRLLVTVSAAPAATAPATDDAPAAGGSRTVSGKAGGGDAWRCGKPPHPFRDGFLHLECEPAPVPPPTVAPHSAATSTPVGEDAPVDGQSLPAPLEPARPRPERAFFWGDFLPVVVGSDGQPTEGIPLPFPPVGSPEGQEGSGAEQEVTVPVWVRSETAGKVAFRARVVYGLGGKSPGAAGGGRGASKEGVAVTEWARAEVLCVRPLATTVDVVSLQATEDGKLGGGGAADGSVSCKRPGHTVAVKV
ncbi:unnamed protein product, partial [Scytosiphon promiscuus]